MSANTRHYAAEVKELKITNWNGKSMTILPQFLELDLHMSIHAKALHASVMLVDSIDLIKSLPIVGGEQIELAIETPTLDPIDVKFKVVDITAASVARQGYSKAYVLRCVSDAALLNKKGSAQKAYKGTADTIISQIAKEQLSVANVDVETCSTTLQLNIPDILPFAGIDYVNTLAVSSDHPGSLMFFYEDQNGHHFKSAKGLYAAGKEYTYKYYPQNVEGNEEDDQWRILTLKRHKVGGHMKKIEGVVENELVEFDILTRTFKATKFDYKKDYAKAHAVGQSKALPDKEIEKWQTANNSAFFGESTAVRYRSKETAFGLPAFGVDEKHGAALAQRKLLAEPVATISAPGYTELKLGDRIRIDVVEQVGTTEPSLDKFYAEPFLVGAIRHVLNPNMKHFMVVDLYRDGEHEEVSDTEFDLD